MTHEPTHRTCKRTVWRSRSRTTMMRPHGRKFLDDVEDNRTVASAAPAPSFRPRDYYIHTRPPEQMLQPTTNTGNNVFPPPNETITRKPFGESNFGIGSAFMALTVSLALTAFCFVGLFSVHMHSLSQDIPPDDPRRRGHQTVSDRASSSGIDPSTVQSLPLFAYDGNVKEPIDCPICLSEFEEKEMVKVIPFCSHFFHPKCIDMWLSAHGSCPLCRSTQLLLPLPLPPPPPPPPHDDDHKDPSSCFVSRECMCGGPSLLQSRIDIPSPTEKESEGQQQQRKVPLPIPIPSSYSAVTRANSFSSSSRLRDGVYFLPRSTSF